jgi:hypothetical protein
MNDMDDFDYLPEDPRPVGGAYPDGRQPMGRYRDARQPRYPSARMNGTRTSLLSDDRAASGYPPPNGKRILAWLPFGNRLVLLPQGTQLGGDRELREHRDVSGGWLRPAVFGAMDGLVTNSSLIAGIGGGGGGHGMIVLTGIAGLIAGAFSMATGEYISVTSQNELTAAEVELERLQHIRDPRGLSTRTCARNWGSTRMTCRHRGPQRRRRSQPSPPAR